MKLKTIKLLSFPISVAVGFIGAVFTLNTFASGSVMLLSPATHTVNNGATFAVQVRANVSRSDSGDDDGITARLSFSRTRLQVVSMSAAGSSFTRAPQQNFSNSNGTINIFQDWGNTEPTGNLLITTITFRAISNGSGSVAYTYAEVGNDDAATSGGNYTIVTPSPPPPPAPPASAPSPPPPAPSDPPAPKPVSPAPTSPASPSPSSPPAATTPAPTPSSSIPTKPAPANDNSDQSSVFTNLPVALIVKNDKNTPQHRAKVVIDGKTYHTDKQGKVTTKLGAGTYSADITNAGTTKKVTFIVKAQKISVSNKTPKTQTFSFAVQPANPLANMVVIGGLGLFVVILIIASVIFTLKRLRGSRAESEVPTQQPFTPPAVADEVPPPPTDQPQPEQTQAEVIPPAGQGQIQPAYETVEPISVSPVYLAPEVPMVPPQPIAPITTESPIVQPEPSPDVPDAEPVYNVQPVIPTQPEPIPAVQPETIAVPIEPQVQPAENIPPVQEQPQAEYPHRHNNSVYLDEEEPKDMYEVANEQFHYRDHPTQQQN